MWTIRKNNKREVLSVRKQYFLKYSWLSTSLTTRKFHNAFKLIKQKLGGVDYKNNNLFFLLTVTTPVFAQHILIV